LTQARHSSKTNYAMKKHLIFAFILIAASLGAGLSALAQQPVMHWVGSWASSPMGQKVNPGQPSPANSTYRNIVRISAGGPSVRVVVSNEFGSRSLIVGSAHVALSAGNGAIQDGSDHALTFSGNPSVTIPAGAMVVSDPAPFAVAPLSSLAVSVYLPEQRIGETTCHESAQSTTFISAGDATAAATLSAPRTITSWCFVKGIEVSSTDPHSAAIVTLGDSITDGALSTLDANRRWPDVLAQRLQADPKTARLSVLNEGIGGNRFLREGAGQAALARFDRDVLGQSGVRYLIILEGINDIGSIARPRDAEDALTAPQLTSALTLALSQLATRAHAHGIKVFGATLTPYVGAGYASPPGEETREAVNNWMRTSGVFDGVIDFDKATSDPAKPNTFLPSVDSGDHLHPDDAGYQVMGSAIDLSLFE
jgi:lysophospholipase L1-like esterase